MGKKEKGQLSAYSVFNKGQKKILGDVSMQEIDAQFGLKSNFNNNSSDDDNDLNEDALILQNTKLNKISKMNNKPCYCGSNKKFKKCCYWRELRAKEQNNAPKYD